MTLTCQQFGAVILISRCFYAGSPYDKDDSKVEADEAERRFRPEDNVQPHKVQPRVEGAWSLHYGVGADRVRFSLGMFQ